MWTELPFMAVGETTEATDPVADPLSDPLADQVKRAVIAVKTPVKNAREERR
jgi:hypothetical protein